MRRRPFITGLIGSAFAIAAPPWGLAYDGDMPSGQYEYAILVDGRESGRHSVQVENSGGHCTANMKSIAAVRLLGMPIFRYSHFCEEVWHGPVLAGFYSRTDDNGRALRVAGRSTASGFLIDMLGTLAVLPSDVAPATYWNRAILERAYVLDPEDGRLFRQQAGEQRAARLDWARASTVTEIDVTSFTSGVIWYDEVGRLLGCRFKKDSHDIEFRALPA